VEEFDYIVVGGGLFGVYTALHLAQRKHAVCLLEKEDRLFTKAAVVNQARLHSGYHYPRSVATANQCICHKDRFARDHIQFINSSFKQYYAIDKHKSRVDSFQFEEFCRAIKAKALVVADHFLFNYDHLERVFLAEEVSFDPRLVASFYTAKVQDDPNISLRLNAEIAGVEARNGAWKVGYRSVDDHGVQKTLAAPCVINATYAGTNGINRLFGMKEMELKYELTEIVLVRSNELKGIGLTVMDGKFASIMPYGLTGLLVLSSVYYTPHKVSFEDLPRFDCQQSNKQCRPDFLARCDTCSAKPASNYPQMIRQVSTYLKNVHLKYCSSMYAIKAKLRSSAVDDRRPTKVMKLHENPDFICVFAGKVNCIYEIEAMLS